VGYLQSRQTVETLFILDTIGQKYFEILSSDWSFICLQFEYTKETKLE